MQSIFLLTASWLLDHKALKVATSYVKNLKIENNNFQFVIFGFELHLNVYLINEFIIYSTTFNEINFLQFAEIALSKELLETRESSQADYYIALSRLQLMSKQYDEALNSLNRATAIDHQVCSHLSLDFVFY